MQGTLVCVDFLSRMYKKNLKYWNCSLDRNISFQSSPPCSCSAFREILVPSFLSLYSNQLWKIQDTENSGYKKYPPKSLGVPLSPLRDVHDTGVRGKAGNLWEVLQGCTGNKSAESGRTAGKSRKTPLASLAASSLPSF